MTSYPYHYAWHEPDWDEPDWDAGTENAYDEHRERGIFLCERCGENAPLPNEDWCALCTLEVETALAEAEEAA